MYGSLTIVFFKYKWNFQSLKGKINQHPEGYSKGHTRRDNETNFIDLATFSNTDIHPIPCFNMLEKEVDKTLSQRVILVLK